MAGRGRSLPLGLRTTRGARSKARPESYFALEKSSTANNRPLRSTMPIPTTFMSVSSMFARCCGDFTNWAWINDVLGPKATFSESQTKCAPICFTRLGRLGSPGN